MMSSYKKDKEKAPRRVANDYNRNSISISIFKTTDGASTHSLDTLDQSFMYTQILKEILLTIDFDQRHVNEFSTYYRAKLVGEGEKKNVDKIAKEYYQHEPIWWYTSPTFLYSMVNKALRSMEVDLIIKMGFFIRDLHQHITKLHGKQLSQRSKSNSITVYRGQGLSQTVFNQLKQTQGGLMSFNSFLSTSLDQTVSLTFAESNQYHPGQIGVLFIINIDPSILSSPFANITEVSYFREEEEILFSMHSVFRIRQVKRIDGNNCLWQVDLTLTNDNDPELHALTKIMQKETYGRTGWHRLGLLMIRLAHFNKAEELYNRLLEQRNNESQKAYLYNMLARVYDNMKEYSKALLYNIKAIEIQRKTLPTTHPSLITSYNNIGVVYHNMREYAIARSCFEKVLEIKQKTLPADHYLEGVTYHNIGMVYQDMGQCSEALPYFEKAIKLKQKSLPANHPSLIDTYICIGELYYNMGEYTQALSYFERVLVFQQRSLPPNHPSIKTAENFVEMVKKKL